MKVRHLLILASLLIAGCAESEGTEKCVVSSDCSRDNFVCFQGECQSGSEARPCTSAAVCLPGESCDNGFCSDGGTPDMTTMDMSAPDMTSDTSTTNPPDAVVDLLDSTPPTITSMSPVDQATAIALDTTVTVTFSEELITGTVNANNLFAEDAFGRLEPGTVSYDEATMTATLTFDAPLQPWTEYQVTASSGIRDRGMNSLVEVRWNFSTVAPDLTAHEALARAYAPSIHQDAADPKSDLPVAIDFDGDLITQNNRDNAQTGVPPVVYYAVSETETHHFIHYILYYPIFKAGSAAPEQSHAVAGILVVVAKGADALGTLQLFQTYSVGYSPGQIDTFLPECSGGGEPFCPTGFSPQGAVIDTFHNIPAAQYAEADGRRVKVYVKHLDHEICHWEFDNTGAGYCGRPGGGGTYFNSDYAVLTPATAGAAGTVDFSTSHTGTYELRHIADPWWTNRASVGGAMDDMYGDSALYTPGAITAIGGAGDLRFPTTINATDPSSNLGYVTPWAMDSQDGFALERGAWFVDPARSIKARLNVPANFEDRANKYCYSLWTGIDRGAEAACQ